MFFTYLGRELRRRMRQVVFISLGLAVGIGLVITVTAASAGVAQAQGRVLHSLYGVGTDITVTTAPSRGSGGPVGFRVRGQQPSSGATPKAGQKFSRDVLVTGARGTLKSSSVTTIAQTQNVTAAAGALSATNLSISGKVPASTGGALRFRGELRRSARARQPRGVATLTLRVKSMKERSSLLGKFGFAVSSTDGNWRGVLVPAPAVC